MKLRTRLLLVTFASLFAIVAIPGVAFAQQGEDEVEASEFGTGLPPEEIEETVHHLEEEGVLADDHATVECLEIILAGGEVAECEESPSPVLPAINELIWGTIFFAVVLILLIKFAFPPLRASLQAREEKIRGDLESAEQARMAAQSTQSDYEAQLADARNEASRIVEEARGAAEQVGADVKARAEEEAAEVRARAAADARLASERALADLQTQVGEISIGLAEKIVERNLDRDTQMQLVESYIEEVGRN